MSEAVALERFTLRPACAGDAPAIEALLSQLGYSGSDSFLAARIEQLLAHPDAVLLVGEWSGRVVAVISLHYVAQLALRGDFARISYFCIETAARGHGIGRRIAQHCEMLARARGCDRMELHCHSRRVDAHRFYEKLGYVESPRYYMLTL